MAINKKTLNEYRAAMQAVLDKVEFSTFYRSINEKLIDLSAKLGYYDRELLRLDIKKIFDPKFTEYVDGVFKEYDYLVDLVNDKYRKLPLDINRDMDKIRAIEQINQTRLGHYSESAVNKITDVVRKGIADKLTRTELAQRIDYVGSTVSGYADTISKTQLKGYGRALKNQKANIAEVYYYEYVNPLHDNSRQFCIDHVGLTFHLDDINKMENGPKQLKPVIDYCGGWNCNHDWEPDPFYEGV